MYSDFATTSRKGLSKMNLVISLLLVTIGFATAQDATALDLSPIASLGEYSTLLEALSTSGADQVIADNVPVTILGPDDQAFAELDDGPFSSFIDGLSTDELQEILLNHVIVGIEHTSESVENDGGCVVATTAGGTKVSLFLDPTNGELDVDSLVVIDKDVTGGFGVFHGIESVMLPGEHLFLGCPEPSPPADLTPIKDLGKYNTFVDAIEQTGLAPIINQYVSAIFAPTDEAFASLDLDSLSSDELSAILKDHLVFSHELFTFDILGTKCTEASTMGGRRIAMRYDDTTGVFDVNGIPINTDADVTLDYAVLHGLDGVLTDESSQYVTCLDFAPILAKGQYNTFVDALQETKINEVVGDLAPVTMFGPTDAALAAAIENLTDDELDDVVANHVVFEKIDFQRIVFNGCIDELTLSDMKVAIRYDSETGAMTINGIPVVEKDIVSDTFGVFHGIDGVLMDGSAPYTPCLDFSPILDAGNYSSFLSAMNDTDAPVLISLLRPVTILAPTDSALAAVDPSLLTHDVIGNHVIYDGEIFASDVISAGCTNVQVGDMYIDIRYDTVTGLGTVNGIPIVSYDTIGDFGVMHGLDGVLIPGVTPFTPCADFLPIEQAGNYGSLLALLNQTEQNQFISSLSPVTFFGPTDAALFTAQDTLAGLSDEDLISVVKSHILTFPSNLTLEEVEAAGCVEAFIYGSLSLEVSIRYDTGSGTMSVNGIPVVESIFGDYGVMHGISGVIGIDGEFEPCPLPDDDDDFFVVGPTFDILNDLSKAFEEPLLSAMLEAGETTVTIFGPSDEAFSAVDEPETQSEILQVLKGHIVPGEVTSAQIRTEECMVLDTLAGTKIRAMVAEDGTIVTNGATVILVDEIVDGATIHGIDKVIFPGSFEPCPTKPTTPPATDAPNSGVFAAGMTVMIASIIALMVGFDL